MALILGIISMQAQEFQQTDKYKLIQKVKTKQEPYGSSYKAYLESTERSSCKLAELTITDKDFFETAHISILDLPGLKGIAQVLKVDLEYAICRIPIKTHYFMVTQDADVISLPKLTNAYCNILAGEERYIFPNEPHGKEGLVQKAKVHYSKEGSIQKVSVLHSFYWKDDDFDMENPLRAFSQLGL